MHFYNVVLFPRPRESKILRKGFTKVNVHNVYELPFQIRIKRYKNNNLYVPNDP